MVQDGIDAFLLLPVQEQVCVATLLFGEGGRWAPSPANRGDGRMFPA